ncbi:MAG: hypothetical protein ABR573_07925 [Candidatus Dormibacteria bacterium]
MVDLLILGIRTRYVLAAAVLLAIVLVLAVLGARRARRGRLSLRELTPADTDRYRAAFADLEREFVDRPAQSAARARGLVEEVMRRRGFPDRIEPAQRVTDVSRQNRPAGRALESANGNLVAGPTDTEKLRLAVQGYRAVLQWLIGEETERQT